MMPFKRTYGWVSGREEYTLTEIKPNVPVDDAKFVKPPAAKITPIPLTRSYRARDRQGAVFKSVEFIAPSVLAVTSLGHQFWGVL